MPGEKLLLPKRLAIFAIVAAVALSVSAASSADSYVFRDGDITWMFGRGMSAAALQQLKSANGAEFIWARRGAHAYLFTMPRRSNRRAQRSLRIARASNSSGGSNALSMPQSNTVLRR